MQLADVVTHAGGSRPAAFTKAAGRIALEVGGLTIAVTSREPDLGIALTGASARFAADPQQPAAIHIEARWATLDDATRGRQVFDSGGVWQLHDVGTERVFSCRSPKFGSQPYKTATMAADFSAGTVSLDRRWFDPSQPHYPLEYPLDELIATNWLALGRGVEVHACAVRDADGAGYLFAGHSGAGKSTIARLWQARPGVTVLSDDRVILRKIESEIWMYGTPWHGEAPLASPDRARLTRGFFLRHAPSNQFAPVGAAQAVAKLFACSFPPFFSAAGLDFTLAFLGDVSGRVPFQQFGFVPDDRIFAEPLPWRR